MILDPLLLLGMLPQKFDIVIREIHVRAEFCSDTLSPRNGIQWAMRLRYIFD